MAAIPTPPTIAWGTLRQGIELELCALATIADLMVFALLFIAFMLIRLGFGSGRCGSVCRRTDEGEPGSAGFARTRG